jgi:hypothetical protein
MRTIPLHKFRDVPMPRKVKEMLREAAALIHGTPQYSANGPGYAQRFRTAEQEIGWVLEQARKLRERRGRR